MDYKQALQFVKQAKQPPAYFDHEGDRYRFDHPEFYKDKNIYNFMGKDKSISITLQK